MPGTALTALMPVNDYHDGYLGAAFASVLGQTDPRWRLLVSVERSARAGVERVLADGIDDPRVEVIVNQRRGLAGAFNTGMRRAETEFVAILLGDDAWSPDAVSVLRHNIARFPATDFFHSSRRIVDDDGRPISRVHRSRDSVSLDVFRRGTSPVKHLLCWRRELGLAIGGMDESLRSIGIDDFDFPWSMAEAGATFTSIPECLYVYRDHRECFRLTTHVPLRDHRHEFARIMRKHGVDRATIAASIAAAERAYLQQCLYRSRLDRWVKRLRRHNTGGGWREQYT
ncbi:MAG: glycosyltransferase [Actinomycetota bacterium]|nr:glycosyltransferase [Actinomycetota bacterium]